MFSPVLPSPRVEPRTRIPFSYSRLTDNPSILGSTTYAIFKESDDKEKEYLYEKYYPLISRLWKEPNNQNSRYNYFKSQQVSIFPKEKVTYQLDIYGNKIRNEGEFHRDIKLIKPKYTTTNQILGNIE